MRGLEMDGGWSAEVIGAAVAGLLALHLSARTHEAHGVHHQEQGSPNVLVGVLQTIGPVLSGRVHFERGSVGSELETDDGARYRVFRRAVVERDAPPAAALFIVRFTPAHMTVRQNIWFSWLPTLVFTGFAGFRSKYWCVDDATGACQSVYEWQARADAEAYAASVALRS